MTTRYAPLSECEVRTENGDETPSRPFSWRRAALIAALVVAAGLALLLLLGWLASVADASAPGGCGG